MHIHYYDFYGHALAQEFNSSPYGHEIYNF